MQNHACEDSETEAEHVVHEPRDLGLGRRGDGVGWGELVLVLLLLL